MDDVFISGVWDNLGAGHVKIHIRPGSRTHLRMNIEAGVPAANASISVSLTMSFDEIRALAIEFDRLIDTGIGQATLYSDWPNTSLHFRWRDTSRSVAELNGRLVQGLSMLDELWKYQLDLQRFSFEGVYLQRLADLLQQIMTEYGIEYPS